MQQQSNGIEYLPTMDILKGLVIPNVWMIAQVGLLVRYIPHGKQNIKGSEETGWVCQHCGKQRIEQWDS